ncbi:MAG: ThuA domain-containing protein [Myxococcota bacterium]
MSRPEPFRVHVVVGGFPPGAPAAHDMDHARLRILGLLAERPEVLATVSSDFADLERWLPGSQLLVSYVAGPYLDEAHNALTRDWIRDGGHWLALHGTSGGRATPVGGDRRIRQMQRSAHHDTLGCLFLNHPPIRRFRVDVADPDHPLARGLPASFEVDDELYLVELLDPTHTRLLLTTDLEKDPSPEGFGFFYPDDTSVLADGRTRALAYTRALGRGAVTYVALGHCHSPTTNVQPFVDASVSASGTTPLSFRGSWEAQPFEQLLRNAIAWRVSKHPQPPDRG